jgi:hypothetical protein
MKKVILLISFLFFKLCTFSQNALDWVVQIDSGAFDENYTIATDKSGNILSAGLLSIVTKHDPSGNLLWSVPIHQGYGRCEALAIDKRNNIYASGYNTNNSYQTYVCKLDSNGNLIWMRMLGGYESFSVTVDKNGNVYSAGCFNGTRDFDPGIDTFNLTPYAQKDSYISKLDSMGNFVWAVHFRASNSNWTPVTYIASDNNDNLYASGYFDDTCDVDPGAGVLDLVPQGPMNTFLIKLDQNANLIWAHELTSANYTQPTCIAIDTADNVYVGGKFSGTCDLDPGTGVFNLTAQGLSDMFICKLNRYGNFTWAGGFGCQSSNGSERLRSVAADKDQHVYLTGEFNYTVDFDPGPGTYNMTAAGTYDAFISQLDESGNFICAGRMGATSMVYCTGIAVNEEKEIYVTGYFYDSCDFDPGTGIHMLNTPNYQSSVDIFIVKLHNCETQTGLVTFPHADPVLIFPNPSKGEFIISGISMPIDVTIYDLLGEKIMSRKQSTKNVELTIPKGLYMIRLVSGNTEITKKLVIQ